MSEQRNNASTAKSEPHGDAVADVPSTDRANGGADEEDVSEVSVAAEPDAEDSGEPVGNSSGGVWGRVIVSAVIALLTLAVGFATGIVVATPKYPSDNSAEAGFARDMSMHHAQAVHMGMMEYRNGDDDQARTMAYDIATSQQAQIGVMDSWLREWKLTPTSNKPAMSWMDDGKLLPDGRMPGMAAANQLSQLEHAQGRDADVLFCQLMITHHLGGIHMAQAILDMSHNSEVRRLAQTMVNNQQYDINQLRDILKRLGATP